MQEVAGILPQQVADLEQLQDVYERQVQIKEFPRRLDEDSWGHLLPAGCPPVRRSSPSLAEVEIDGQLLKLVNDPPLELRADVLVWTSAPHQANECLYNEIQNKAGPGVQAELKRFLAQRRAGQQFLTQYEYRFLEDGESGYRYLVALELYNHAHAERQASLDLFSLQDSLVKILKECTRRKPRVETVVIPWIETDYPVEDTAAALYNAVKGALQADSDYPKVVALAVQEPHALVCLAQHLAREKLEIERAKVIGGIYQNRYPFPVASSYQRWLYDREWAAEETRTIVDGKRLVELMERTIEFLTVLACAEYLSSEIRSPEVDEKLWSHFVPGGKSIGDWKILLQTCLEFLEQRPGRLFLQKLAEVSSCLGDMDWLIARRNPDTHGRASLPVEEFSRRLHKLLKGLGWLADYEFLAANSIKPQAKNKIIECRSLIGYDTFHHKQVLDCSLDLKINWPFLVNRKRKEILYLFPFYALTKCNSKKCTTLHLLKIDRVNKHSKPAKVIYATDEEVQSTEETFLNEAFQVFENLVFNPGAAAPVRQTGEILRFLKR